MGSYRIDTGQTPANKHPSTIDNTDASKPIEEPSVPTTSAGLSEPQSPSIVGNNPKTRKKRRYTRDPGIFWIGVATLIAIIVYAYYARQQAIYTEKAAKAAKDSADAATAAVKVADQTLKISIDSIQKTLNEMHTQSTAMKDSAKAAKDSNQIVRAANSLDRRAWIGVKGIRRHTDPEPNKKLTFVILIQNSGRTPARKVSIYINVYFNKPTLDTIDPSSNSPYQPELSMAPGAELQVPYESAPLSVDFMKNITDKVPLYVYGTIHYIDVENINRETTFCAIYVYKASFDPLLTCCSEFNEIK